MVIASLFYGKNKYEQNELCTKNVVLSDLTMIKCGVIGDDTNDIRILSLQATLKCTKLFMGNA